MSVKVRRERPDQRRYHRVTAPLYVAVGGQRLRAADWSLGGLRIEGFAAPLPAAGASLELQLTLPFQGFEVTFPAKGEVVRTDPAKGTVALKFTELGERERRLMQHFIEDLIRGAMSEVEDTIQRIDVPITPVSTKPDASPKSQVPVNRWPVKTIVYTSAYLVLGFFVFSYAALMTYSNVFRLEVDAAVISAPLETVRAETDGRVMWTSYKPGDLVTSGARILDFSDSALEREIEFADIEVGQRQAQLLYLKRQHLEELSRMEDLADVQVKDLEQTRMEVAALEAEAEAAENQLARVRTLIKKGFATRAQLDQARQRAVAARSAFESRKLELASRSKLAEKGLGSRYYAGDHFLGERAKLEAEIKLAEHDIEAAQQKKAALANQRARLAVYAPFDGLLLDLPRIDQGTVRRGDVLAVIEQPRSRQITAFLTQDEVLQVGLGDEALVYVPSLDQTLAAYVTAIDRTSGFIDEVNGSYTWRSSRDRTAKVQLAFRDTRPKGANRLYRSGTPVIVIFEARSTSQLMSQVTKPFRVLFGASREPAPVAAEQTTPQPSLKPTFDDGPSAGALRPSLTDEAAPAPEVPGTPT